MGGKKGATRGGEDAGEPVQAGATHLAAGVPSAAFLLAYTAVVVAVTAGCTLSLGGAAGGDANFDEAASGDDAGGQADAVQNISAGDASSADRIRYLFSTPLFVSNVAENIDVAALTTLALSGYKQVKEDAELIDSLREGKKNYACGGDVECASAVMDDEVFTPNDKFCKYTPTLPHRCSSLPYPTLPAC